MGSEANTTVAAGAPAIIVPLEPARPPDPKGAGAGASASEVVGGKARSLVRLMELGVPVPRAFAVTPALWQALRVSGPPLPERLATANDLAALDAAREALTSADFPAGFLEALDLALADTAADSGVASSGVARFAVRSSAEGEDGVGSLAAGLYASVLPVARAEVPAAIRAVLASFLTPAAWAYATSAASSHRDGGVGIPGGAVLIHPFIDGDTWGTAAAEPRGANEADVSAVRIEPRAGAPTEAARARIAQAARTAAAKLGAVELEWVARRDVVTFLQMRSYQAAPDAAAAVSVSVSGAGAPAVTGDFPAAGREWTWDAAHNPAPLSPAQTGLVELVDNLCLTPFRQRVIGGYLFWKSSGPEGREGSKPTGTEPRPLFEELRLTVEAQIDQLGPAPSLEGALTLFVRAYEPLFGVVAPACAAARAAFLDFLRRHLPAQVPRMPLLLSDVSSVASRRRDAVRTLIAASTPAARQAALEAYLRLFGDESPRWDVVEPTLREAPRPLLLLASTGGAPAGPTTIARDDSAAAAGVGPQAAFERERTEVRSKLEDAEGLRAEFDTLLSAARDAVAVGEDDDALFARLQALVRRALLTVGERLVNDGQLDAADDIFYLPLPVTRAAALGLSRAPGDPIQPPGPPEDLRRISAEGRRAMLEAARGAAARPPLEIPVGAPLVRGAGGAGGRVLGRAVHHPAATPLGPQSVLIAATLLPTELPLVTPGAVVVETGHVLGHVAAQARERGIPAVVGAVGALAAIPEGSLVVVDGDRGEVVLLGP